VDSFADEGEGERFRFREEKRRPWRCNRGGFLTSDIISEVGSESARL
jgi:hypothetical protein